MSARECRTGFSILTEYVASANVPSMRGLFLCMLLMFGSARMRAAEQVPDFKLTDVSMRSNRQGTQVSPRDYLLQVSAYYFGDAG